MNEEQLAKHSPQFQKNWKQLMEMTPEEREQWRKDLQQRIKQKYNLDWK